MTARAQAVLVHGSWQSTIAVHDGECDAVITDPPYTERVILGYRAGSDVDLEGKRGVFNITYAAWKESDVGEFARFTTQRAKHWAVVFNDHVGARRIAQAFNDLGWYVFAPVLWCRTNPPPRFAGDGPTSSTEYIVVARPRKKLKPERSGSRPGHYVGPSENVSRQGLVGQKPEWLMRALVRDYTVRGDLVVDPFAGSGTTLIAARTDGRNAIGSELDPVTYEKTLRRLRRSYTPAFAFGEKR